MTSIFGTTGFFDSDKVQNQQAIANYTNFTGTLAVNGVAVTGTETIQTEADQVQNQAQGIAPAGMRDLWQYGTGSLGSAMVYSSTFDKIWTSGNSPGIAQYSTNGGATFSNCVFDVVPTGFVFIGFNSTVVVALTDDGKNAYKSADGVNFTSVAAPPGGVVSGFNIAWFPKAGLFVAPGTVDSTHNIITSPDGITWTSRASSMRANAIKVNSTMCVATSPDAPYVMSSTDGITWVPSITPLGAATRALAWSEEQKLWMCTAVIALTAYTSTDGLSWTSRGAILPQLPGDSLIWVGNGINRWYGSVIDAAGNYSMVSSPVATTTFVGAYLDGAVTNTLPYSLAYDPGRGRFYMGVNSTPYFAYSTPRPYVIKSLSDDIRVRGLPVDTCLFSTFSIVNVTNTTTETALTTGSILGTLVLQDPITIGAAIEFKIYLQTTSAGGDTLTIRIKSNSVTLHTITMTIPAGASSLNSELSGVMTVLASTIRASSKNSTSGVTNVLQSSANAFTPTITNTLSVTAQWGAAINSLSMLNMVFTTHLRNGA